MNTFIVSCGMALACAAIIRGVANREAELAGEPLERRRITTVWRDYLHKKAADARAKNLEAVDASKTN
ncbi:hypothetical protein R3P38DRAFT_3040406 [Favolaschia claudopus]|uniref:Uncharacterized protein n=1 Tax=Favolaschia claudopus TaxID=2862362 RepID=A0AAW0AB98_9AGAR